MIKASSLEEVTVIRTGLFVDRLSGIGGIPRGVVTEIFGDENQGKSTLCLQTVSAAQKEGLKCLWVDVEYSYSPIFAAKLGVDSNKLDLIRERDAETVLDAVVDAIDSGKYGLVVVDSIGQLTPRAELEKGAGEKVIGAQAALVARFCRRVLPSLSVHKTALVVINHSLVDIMSGKLVTSGGKKLRYVKALAIRLKNANKKLMSGETQVGKVVIGQVWGKNKLAATEGMEIESNLIFNKGFSASADLFMEAVERGVITKDGQSYFFAEKKIGRGLTSAREEFEKDLGLIEQVKALL